MNGFITQLLIRLQHAAALEQLLIIFVLWCWWRIIQVTLLYMVWTWHCILKDWRDLKKAWVDCSLE